jgi:hypothetical protein
MRRLPPRVNLCPQPKHTQCLTGTSSTLVGKPFSKEKQLHDLYSNENGTLMKCSCELNTLTVSAIAKPFQRGRYHTPRCPRGRRKSPSLVWAARFVFARGRLGLNGLAETEEGMEWLPRWVAGKEAHRDKHRTVTACLPVSLLSSLPPSRYKHAESLDTQRRIVSNSGAK